MTLEQMKEKRENLVKERERQLAAALAAAKRCALYGPPVNTVRSDK